jgi:hypothetical protein
MPTILTIGPQPLSAQSLSNSRLITNSSSFTLSGLVINLDITSTIFRVVAGVQPRLISMASIVINPGC